MGRELLTTMPVEVVMELYAEARGWRRGRGAVEVTLEERGNESLGLSSPGTGRAPWDGTCVCKDGRQGCGEEKSAVLKGGREGGKGEGKQGSIRGQQSVLLPACLNLLIPS